MLLLAVLLSDAASTEADERLAQMASLYEEVCLKAFPDDQAVEAAMKARGATELTPDQVKVTLGDDPGRGWDLKDKSASVWLELPPFHACSVRWNSPDLGNFARYHELADRYEKQLGGFEEMEPMDKDIGDIHVHAIGEQKQLPNGYESLFIFEQHINDPKRRAAGETGHVLRFVHQFAPPPEQ
jgi:hypothetical protein